jgi:hypothetical protein
VTRVGSLQRPVAEGSITVSYRLWSRPTVKVDGRDRSGSVTIEIDETELLPCSSITDEDAGPIEDDTFLYRVEFHVANKGY